MLIFIALSIVVTVLATGLQLFRNISKSIETVRKTGLPYVIIPFPSSGLVSSMLNGILAAYLLEHSFTWKWLYVSDRHDLYRHPKRLTEHFGDTFFIIAPGSIVLRTSSAELISQVTHRKNDFPKPVANYTLLNIFGRSIVSQEGADWRRHKKVVGPSFSEKSNKLVFEESLRQAKKMVEVWISHEGNNRSDIKMGNTAPDTMMLSFHVICAAGFDLPQEWPGQGSTSLEKKSSSDLSAVELSGMHTMTFKESMQSLIHNLKWIAIIPPRLLKRSPFLVHKSASKAYSECMSYFREFQDFKRKEMNLGEHDTNGTMDLLGPMIRASEENDPVTHAPHAPILSKEELIGNSFIFFFAGHETTGNHLHFTITYLAMHLAIQKRMQVDIDRVVGSKSISEMSYHDDMPRLYNSMLGAVMNEQIRILPPVLQLVKLASGDQTVTVDGHERCIPDKTMIQFNIVQANRNPLVWPSSPSKITPGKDDLDEFVPDRWLLSANNAAFEDPKEIGNEVADGVEHASFETSGSGSLFKPAKGSFISFSEGPRACPGRRFTQVEVTAVLTAIFQNYSVELDVAEWASDEQISKMGSEERKMVYEKAVAKAWEVLRRCEQKTVTLQMKEGDTVPVRLIERGKERFAGIYGV